MRKIVTFLTLSILAVVAPAMATGICADDDVIAIVLDAEVNGTGYTYDANLFEWSAQFSYGTIWGVATCVGNSTHSGTTMAELRSDDGELATGGERKGLQCWCKMTHPAVSHWVAQSMPYVSAAGCENYCARYCGDGLRSSPTVREGVFGTAGI